jgi:hypothetical protein
MTAIRRRNRKILKLDVYPESIRVFSVFKVLKNYRGPCVKVRKRVGGTTDYHKDFGFKFGELDWQAVQDWLDGIDDGLIADNGIGRVSILYSQNSFDDITFQFVSLQLYIDCTKKVLVSKSGSRVIFQNIFTSSTSMISDVNIDTDFGDYQIQSSVWLYDLQLDSDDHRELTIRRANVFNITIRVRNGDGTGSGQAISLPYAVAMQKKFGVYASTSQVNLLLNNDYVIQTNNPLFYGNSDVLDIFTNAQDESVSPPHTFTYFFIVNDVTFNRFQEIYNDL